MQNLTFIVPTFALPYLVNADIEGLTAEELLIIGNWERNNKIAAVIPVGEEYFSHTNDISALLLAGNVMGCDCLINE